MYESHFGLSGPPFQLIPDPTFYFGSRGHSNALAFLKFGAHQGEGFLVVTGEIGAGKTTLVRTLLEGLDPKSVVAAPVVSTQLEPGDLPLAILMAFGVPISGDNKAQLVTQLEAFLTDLAASGRRALLIVDEAQNLMIEVIEELRLLTNFQLGRNAMLQVFLVGQPELRTLLQSREMEQMRQRVTASCHLGPLDPAETRAYVQHRLKHVGWQDRPRFELDAFQQLHRWTGGIPRRINRLCNRLLLAAFLETKDNITPEDVEQIAKDLRTEIGETDELPPPLTSVAKPAPESTRVTIKPELTARAAPALPTEPAPLLEPRPAPAVVQPASVAAKAPVLLPEAEPLDIKLRADLADPPVVAARAPVGVASDQFSGRSERRGDEEPAKSEEPPPRAAAAPAPDEALPPFEADPPTSADASTAPEPLPLAPVVAPVAERSTPRPEPAIAPPPDAAATAKPPATPSAGRMAVGANEPARRGGFARRLPGASLLEALGLRRFVSAPAVDAPDASAERLEPRLPPVAPPEPAPAAPVLKPADLGAKPALTPTSPPVMPVSPQRPAGLVREVPAAGVVPPRKTPAVQPFADSHDPRQERGSALDGSDPGDAALGPFICLVDSAADFVRARALSRFLSGHPGMPVVKIVHTGGADELSLGEGLNGVLPAGALDEHLNIDERGGAKASASALIRFETVLKIAQPQAVLSMGTSNSVLACSLLAHKSGVPLLRHDAGRRRAWSWSGEEMNALLIERFSDIDYISDLATYFALFRTGIAADKVLVVGDLVRNVIHYADEHTMQPDEVLRRAQVSTSALKHPAGYVLATAQLQPRSQPQKHAVALVGRISQVGKVMPVLWAVNDYTLGQLRAAGLEAGLKAAQVLLLPSLGYLDCLDLLRKAKCLVAGSTGDYVDESTQLSVPTVVVGKDIVVPVKQSDAVQASVSHGADKLEKLIVDMIASAQPRRADADTWDGGAGKQIAHHLESWLPKQRRLRARQAPPPMPMRALGA